jgi:copper chaperone NosL
MRRRALFVWAGAWVVACATDLGPVDPVWGKVACADCAMLVADKRFAAQTLDADGTRLHFDDVGCLAHHLALHPRAGVLGWVRDASRDAWLSVESARFTAGVQTPMDYGFSASAEHGDFTFEDVKKAAASRAEKR